MPKSIKQMRQTIDSIIHGKEDAQTKWSELLANAIHNKDPLTLSDVLSSGKDFNVNSKIAFCKIIESETVLGKKEIDLLIANHCGVSYERLIELRQFSIAEKLLQTAKVNLSGAYANGDELVAWVDELVKSGFNTIKVKGNKSYLFNKELDSGYCMETNFLLDYAKNKCECESLKNNS